MPVPRTRSLIACGIWSERETIRRLYVTSCTQVVDVDTVFKVLEGNLQSNAKENMRRRLPDTNSE